MLSLTNDNINAVVKLGLNDPVGKEILAKDWRKFISDHFELNSHQKANLAEAGGIPKDRIEAIQEAVSNVVKYGGNIRFTGTDPAMLYIKPVAPHPDFYCSVETAFGKCKAGSGTPPPEK